MYLSIKVLIKRLLHKQLFYCICTPFFGNVGDHAIELEQQRLLRKCDINSNLIDLDSYEYSVMARYLGRLIRKQDIIILDGGGNLGDTWPETTSIMLKIIEQFKMNRIIIFPESWYFSNNHETNELLSRTKKTMSEAPNIIIYARDSWSFNELRRTFPNKEIKYAFDCVLYHDFIKKERTSENRTIGFCVRDDRETKSQKWVERLSNIAKNNGLQIKYIQNDCHTHIKKSERNRYVDTVINDFLECDLIVTDRFHGFIFSLITNKPCIIYDNITGKILHFYFDIKDDVDGCYTDIDEMSEDEICSILGNSQLFIKQSFFEKRNQYELSLLNDINSWRDIQ